MIVESLTLKELKELVLLINVKETDGRRKVLEEQQQEDHD